MVPWVWIAGGAAGIFLLTRGRTAKAAKATMWSLPPEIFSQMSPAQQVWWRQREAVRLRTAKGELSKNGAGYNQLYVPTFIPKGCLTQQTGGPCTEPWKTTLSRNTKYSPFKGADWTIGREARIAAKAAEYKKKGMYPDNEHNQAVNWEHKMRPPTLSIRNMMLDRQSSYILRTIKETMPNSTQYDRDAAQIAAWGKAKDKYGGWLPKGWGEWSLLQQTRWLPGSKWLPEDDYNVGYPWFPEPAEGGEFSPRRTSWGGGKESREATGSPTAT